jgi:hypothetical protein
MTIGSVAMPAGYSLARSILRTREEVCFRDVVTTPAGEHTHINPGRTGDGLGTTSHSQSPKYSSFLIRGLEIQSTSP